MQIIDILNNIPALSNANLVAGHQGVHRTVNSVNMMDAPDIMPYLNPHELLLTTAYAVKDQPETLSVLVHSMALAGCAGLAIKTKRFLDEIPTIVIDEANRLHFPLFELSLDYSLGEVLNQTLTHILQQKSDELSYALETHHTFFNLILKGEGLTEIVDKLAELVSSPIVILSSQFDIISLSSEPITHIPSLNLLIEQLALLTEPIEAGIYPIIGTSPSEGFPFAIIQPIPTFQWQGYMIAFTKVNSINKLHSLALEQATNVLGFELLKAQAVKDRARRFKTEFFTELIQGHIQSEQEIIHRGKQYGLIPTESMLCIVGGKNEDKETESLSVEHRAQERDHLYHALKKEYARLEVPFVLFTNKDEYIAIISAKELIHANADAKQLLTQHLSAISERLTTSEKIRLSFGIGSTINKLVDIPTAYNQAMEAFRIGKASNKQMFVQYHHTKEFIDLLRMIPTQDLLEYVEDTFDAWSGIEDAEKQEWQRTLLVFYNHHCHIGETAKQLYIHRNTVLYRLSRIEQLTGIQVRNHADSLRIRMALMIKELLE